MHFINEKILELQPDRIEIMGDLFHTHSIIRLEILEFWVEWIDVLLTHGKEIIVLIGNHDRASTDEFAPSFELAFRKYRDRNLKIVTNPRTEGLFAYVSWYHDHEKFIDVANNCALPQYGGAKVLVCHQTFDGSRYENGFFAPDGIDAKRLNYDFIISGHIHSRQDIQKDGKRILYPGTPKWDTVSDANEEKGIWLHEHDDSTGAIINETFISTAGVCVPILHLTWIEGQELPAIPSGAKVTVELIGTSKWIDGHVANLKGTCQIQRKATDRADRKDRQAGKSFPEFVQKHFVTDMDRIELLKYMRELEIV